GAGILDEPVSSIMTAEVRTVTPADRVDELRETMTTHRIRHVPVVENDRLAGIVSIGDVVKSAIDELETGKASLVDYLHRCSGWDAVLVMYRPPPEYPSAASSPTIIMLVAGLTGVVGFLIGFLVGLGSLDPSAAPAPRVTVTVEEPPPDTPPTGPAV